MIKATTSSRANVISSPSAKRRLGFEEEEKKDKGTRLLSDKLVGVLRAVFSETDKYNDTVVRRKDLLYNLRTNPEVVSQIDADAVLTEDLGVRLTLDEVLAEVEFDEREERKRKEVDAVITKEYITWNQLLDYFERYRPREQRNEEH